MPLERLSISIPAPIARDLRVAAAISRASQSLLIEVALRELLGKDEAALAAVLERYNPTKRRRPPSR